MLYLLRPWLTKSTVSMYGNNGVHTFLLSGEEVTSEVTPLKEISTQVRKQNGEEFPPNSLLHLVAGIQRYIRIEGRPSIDFLKDSQFSEFRMSCCNLFNQL